MSKLRSFTNVVTDDLIRLFDGDGTTAIICARFAVYARYPTTLNRGGEFHKSDVELKAETGIGRRDFDRARKRMLQMEIMEEERKGNPYRRWYTMDLRRLERMLSELLENEQRVREAKQKLARFTKNGTRQLNGEDARFEQNDEDSLNEADDYELSENELDEGEQTDELAGQESSGQFDRRETTKAVPGAQSLTDFNQSSTAVNTAEIDREALPSLSGGGTGITLLSTSGVPFPVFDTRLLDLEQRFRGFDVAAALRELSARLRANPGERVAFDDVDEAMEHWLEMKASGKVRPTSESASSIPETELVR